MKKLTISLLISRHVPSTYGQHLHKIPHTLLLWTGLLLIQPGCFYRGAKITCLGRLCPGYRSEKVKDAKEPKQRSHNQRCMWCFKANTPSTTRHGFLSATYTQINNIQYCCDWEGKQHDDNNNNKKTHLAYLKLGKKKNYKLLS